MAFDRRPNVNITPLIDILLVLLVIFLAALPLGQQELETNLPEQATRPAEASTETIVLVYTADGRIEVNHQAISRDDLGVRLGEIYRDRRDKTLFIDGDRSLRYQRVVDVIDVAKGAGVTRVGVITPGARAGHSS